MSGRAFRARRNRGDTTAFPAMTRSHHEAPTAPGRRPSAIRSTRNLDPQFSTHNLDPQSRPTVTSCPRSRFTRSRGHGACRADARCGRTDPGRAGGHLRRRRRSGRVALAAARRLRAVPSLGRADALAPGGPRRRHPGTSPGAGATRTAARRGRDRHRWAGQPAEVPLRGLITGADRLVPPSCSHVRFPSTSPSAPWTPILAGESVWP